MAKKKRYKSKKPNKGYVVRQMLFKEDTVKILLDALDELGITHNERAKPRADILAKCVEIGLEQAVKEMKCN